MGMIEYFRSLNFPGSDKTARKIVDNKPVFLTGMRMMTYFGQIYNDSSKISLFQVIFCRFSLVMGSMLFLSPIVMAEEALGLKDYILIIHYANYNLGFFFLSLAYLAKSRVYKSFCKVLEEEFKHSKEKLSPSEEKIMNETSRFLVTFVERMFIICYGTAICNIVKGPLLEGAPLPYRGWVPISIDTWPGHVAMFICEVIIPLNACGHLYCSMASFVIHAKQLSAQFEILSISIKETFEHSDHPSLFHRENIIKSKMRRVTVRHQLLVRCLNMFQHLYKWVLFTITIISAVFLCTNIFLLSGSSNDLASIFEFLNLIIPELMPLYLYCWFGQQLTDQWLLIRDTLYEVNWFNESITTRKYILNIMTVTTKSKIIMGGGLQPYNMKGFSEILQASFSYFNMLKALR